MNTINISVVNYLNTLPFIYGLENYKYKNIKVQLNKVYPSICFKNIQNKVSAAGLIPVASFKNLTGYKIFSDYCIGADSSVFSVKLYSNVDLHKIEAILLDYQSITSVKLTKLLAKNFWNINPKWLNTNTEFESQIKDNIGGIVIGDRTFKLQNKFKYEYDLAEEWIKYSKLPFVFAVWVIDKNISNIFEEEINVALKFGIDNLDKSIPIHSELEPEKIKIYLNKNIKFTLNSDFKKGMERFLEEIENIID